ncbi:blast:Chitotriosidase-1 [Drosophila guanche]|uniref:chitinase n=1 Tax=Drosophila guanche TaxID=7266 RepID=A0A3B0JZ90_DROGU|nr:blast:Chitotriosidase-1 [Drosophila guanche]
MLPFRRGAAWQTLFLLCALAYCINEASSEGRVVCYYTNWSVYRPGTAKFNPQNINPYLCTHLVYAFGGFTKDNQMKPFDKYQDIEQGGYAKFTGLKTYNKQLKTMIAIGGWNEASSRFSPLVASNERRQQFIKNILKFLRQNHFDGIDLDWEYPAHREGGKSRDRDNYAQFVQELRAEFEREAQKTGRTRLLLTMAVPAGIEYIDKGYDVPKLNKYLDWFNVLTYDFHSSHEPSVNHHAPLYSLEEDSEYNYDAELNIDYSIKYYLKAGADRDKLVLGIPTYGRSYTLINEESTELGAPAEGPGEQGDATREKGYLAYYEICQTLKDDPEWTVVQPNANVMGPYAYRRNQWVGYDDEAMVRKKAEYVVAHGLGGIMFWAIDNDDFRGTCNGKPYPLIEAAKEAMVDALGLGINEVAKPSGPQKPSRSRSRDNAGQNRNRLNAKTEPPTPANSRRGSSGGRRTSTSTAPPPPSTTFRLTEAEGSSLYIGGRGSTTPPPPTTPDPGSDFKCEEEGFFQHPRDCKKYYWCLDSGPSGLGIVAHQFTCPSGLYFNPAADSCDFARNVPCKTKKSTTASPPVTSTTTTTTTARPNRVTAAPPARPIYAPRTTSSTTSTTTTAAPAAEDELEYEEEGGSSLLTDEEQSPGEEDPQVIKELIDLIRKVGGVEQLEKHLLRNKDGSITLKENSASGAPTTPSTISKSLYDRVLSRPGTLNSFTRNRLRVSETPAAAAGATPETRTESSSNSNSNYSKYSSVLRGNSRQGPQNEGIEKLTEFDGFLKERKQYVTINRHRSSSQGEAESDSESEEAVEEQSEGETTTRRPISAATPSYTSLRRARPSTTATPAELSQEQEEEEEEQSLSQVKSYTSLSRQRGRGTSEKSEATTTRSSTATESTTNRYKYLERTRPTKSGNSGVAAAAEDAAEDDDEEYEDEQQQNVTVQSKQSLTGNQNTRKYASIGRSRTTTTTTETTPETTTTTTTTTKGTETAKASTTTTYNNSSYNVKQNNNKNNNNNNNHQTIPTATAESTTTPPPQPQSPSTTTTQPETTTNETTEPIESTTTASTNQHTSPNTPTTTTTPTPTPTPILGSTTNSIDSDSLATIEPLGDATPTIPLVLDVVNSTTTEPELGTTTTTTPTTTTATVTITGNTERNDVDVDDSDDSEVTKTKTQYTKYAATNRRRVTTTTTTTPTTTNNNSEAAIDASRNGLNSISNTNVNSIRTNYSGRRQPQRTTTNTQTTTATEPQPLPTTNPNNTLGSVSSPRPFGYPRRRTRPTVPSTTSTTTINDSNSNDNSNDNANSNDKQITDAVVNVVKKTRLSQVDRPKVSLASLTAATTTNTTTTATTATSAPQQHHQNVEVVVDNGNGGNSLRHDVVRTIISKPQNNADTGTATGIEAESFTKAKYTWRSVRGPAGARRGSAATRSGAGAGAGPNALAGDDKDTRRYAGKQLSAADDDDEEQQQLLPSKYRSRRLNSAEEESEAAIEATILGSSSVSSSTSGSSSSSGSSSRTYQSIQRTASRGAGASSDDQQIRYQAISRDNAGTAHLTAGRSSSFVKDLGEATRQPTRNYQPISRGGQIVVETNTEEDENVAAEVIDDELPSVARGRTKAPAANAVNTDDSNTATEQESPEIVTEVAPEPQILDLAEATTLPAMEDSDSSSSSTTEESTSTTTTYASTSTTTTDEFSSSTTPEPLASSSTDESILEETTLFLTDETATDISESSSTTEQPASSASTTEQPASSSSTTEPPASMTSTTESQPQETTFRPGRRPFNRGSSTTTTTEINETTTTETTKRRPLLRGGKTTTTEEPLSSSSAKATTAAKENDLKTSEDGATTRRTFFRGGRTSTTEVPSTTTTTEAPSKTTTTEANSSSTSTTSEESLPETTSEATTRRSFFRNKTPSSTTEATSTTTEGEIQPETTTGLPRRRVIVRGNFRPQGKEGDLSSLLAADANKRSRYNHQESRRVAPKAAAAAPNEYQEEAKVDHEEAQEDQEEAKADQEVEVTEVQSKGTGKFHSRASLNGAAVRNRTSTKTESLGNGITRTRTTYVRTLDAGQKVVKRIYTKTVEEKPAEYEYIYDEVSHAPPPSTTERVITRNRGTVRFQSNDLSSLLALDFSTRGQRKKTPPRPEATVTKTRRRLLKKPKETIEHEEVEEFEYEAGNDIEAEADVEDAPHTTSTTARAIQRRTRPTRSTTARPATSTTTRPTTTTTTRATSTDSVEVEASTRRSSFAGFRRPSTTTTESPTTTTATTEAPPTAAAATTRRVLTQRRLIGTRTTTTEASIDESTTTEDQLSAAKQRFVNRLRSSSTTTTTTPASTTTEEPLAATTEEDLSVLKRKLNNAVNRLQSGNEVKVTGTDTGKYKDKETSEEEEQQLSLPIYHRRKYYQYVKDSPITYIDKSPAPPDIESVTVNIRQQIHDVFNVSAKDTINNSVEVEDEVKVKEEKEPLEHHRLAMEQAKEINAELGHFLLKTPGSQGKTFKTIPLTTASSNETSNIVSISLLEDAEAARSNTDDEADAQRSEEDARALRTYSKLNRTRLTLSTRLQIAEEQPAETTTRRSYSVPQRFRSRSTTVRTTTKAAEEVETEEGAEVEAETEVPPSEITTRRSFAALNRLRNRGTTTKTTEATNTATEATTSTARTTRQPYKALNRRVTTTTELPAGNEIETKTERATTEDATDSSPQVDTETEKAEEKKNEEEAEDEELLAELPEDNEISDEEEISSTPTAVTTSSTSTEANSVRPTPRRQLVIRRRFNGTTTTLAPTTDDSLDNEIETSSTTTAGPAARRPLLIRRRFNGTATTTRSTTTVDKTDENEIEQGDSRSKATANSVVSGRQPLLIRRRFNGTTTTTARVTLGGGSTNADDAEKTTRRPYAALNRSRNRYGATTSRTTTTTAASDDGDDDNDNENDYEEIGERVESSTARGGFLQTNRHRALKPVSFATRRSSTAAPPRISSSTRRNLVALNRNLYHRAEEEEEETEPEPEPEEEHQQEEEYDEEEEEEPQQQLSGSTPRTSTRLSQLLASRQRTSQTTTTDTTQTQKETETETKQDEDVDVDEDDIEADVDDDAASSVEVSNTNSNNSRNRFQLSRTRGSSSRNSTTESGISTTAATPTTTPTRRFAFGSRQRTQQVTKLTQVDDDEQTEENEQTKDSQESSQEDTTTAATIKTTTTSNSNTFSKPTPKRIRVLKFRRPINTTENSTATNSATESTENHTNNNTVNPTLNTTETTPTTVNTNNSKRFRKIVRKLRPVEASTSSSPASGADESTEDGTTTTRKPFLPSHTRFAGGESQDNDLLNLRQRLKEQQAKGEPLDGVLSTRLKPASGLAQKSGAEDQDISELQRLRDKVKAEQARGTGEQGVINDRLKKLLAEKSEKSDKSDKSEIGSNNEPTPATEVSSRPFFKRKLVARRPYTPAGGATTTTKAPLSFNSSRPTPKFVRRKNGRFDPFNSSVRNRGEGFVRSDPRGSRLPGADRFKNQKAENEEEAAEYDDDDNAEEEQSDEAVEAQQEQPLNNRPLGAGGVALRRPFVPKARNQPQSQKSQNEESEEEDEEEEEDDEEDEEEEDNNNDNKEAKYQTEEGSSSGGATPKPKFNNPYRPKDNRALPGSRPSFAPTAGGSGPGTGPGGSNVPYNPRGRQPNSSTANGSGSVAGSRFGGSTKRPRVVNRPPGVATPNLTLRPVASDYERTTPLTPLKPAPFIPSNTRSYERKYTGPSTEATETASENSLIEELNIDALNARNKKIFDINSKKHTTLKPKVVKVEAVETETEVETGTEMETTEQVAQEQEQGYVTTTPSTPPTTTQPDTSTNNTTTDTTPSIETDNETTAPPPQILPQNPPPTNDNETHNANEAPSSLPQDLTLTGGAQLSTSTTQSPPPATTLLHVFTLLEGEGEGDEQAASTSTSRPPAKSYPASVGRQTIAEPKHKLIEINRIVEINSKQAKAAQRKSKANQQDFGMLRVESLPHVEQLGEISVVKYVHLVDGSAIQINDGHSTVADYTPTEPTATSDYRSLSAPVRNTLPLSEADTGPESEVERSGKSLPEVISGALETSTISLEGLFDSARKGKQLNSNSILQDTEETTTMESETTVVPPTAAAIAAQATYLRQPTTANVSRRPVLSVRRRIINTPTSAAAAAAAATTTQIAELTTTSKYNRLRSRPAATATTIPAAATAATTTAVAAVGATSATATASASASRGSSNSNGYLSKLKAKSSSSAETTSAIASSSSNSNSASSNDITQKQHKFQPASFALRRQFQTRRLTTFAPGASSGDESATEVPRTQNPLFKRRLTLISTTPPPATRTTIVPTLTETTTNLYANEDDEDQVAKSSIHTSRFNQIPFESVASSGSQTTTTSSSPTTTSTSTTPATPLGLGPGKRRQLVPRPRRPQSTTVATPYYSTGNPGAGHSAPPLSRRQQSRRRPHKYIEVYSRPPSKPALVTATASSRRSDYPATLDYEEGAQRRRSSKSQSALQSLSQSEPKVIVHGRGIIECRAQGNFPHPLNCRKFISCARFEETGGIVGWEYTCPKGLTYDGNGGMCTWSPSDQAACRD